MDRRHFFKITAAFSLCGCNDVISSITGQLGQNIPEKTTTCDHEQRDGIYHFLSRATYGVWPGDLEYIHSVGKEAWLEEQLYPEKIEDTPCRLRARRFETIHHHPAMCYEYKKNTLRSEMLRHTLLRSIYSKRQLFEVMVEFWSDHFNIHMEKGHCIYLKATDDRDVIRKNALGKFRDLLYASAISPAMLIYLDGQSNKKAAAEDIPNENYARELLELHTLGVYGGYTQKDVSEVARALTGWRVRKKWNKGHVFFQEKLHDQDEKIILGHKIKKNGGAKDLEQVIDIVCSHPSTANFIAYKLIKRFVSPAPPKSLVSKISKVFLDTDGDIKSLLRAIFLSPEFFVLQQPKFKRPFHFMVSSIRHLGGDTHAERSLTSYLEKMGHVPFQYPTPDGYPDEMEPWLGTLLWRWNFAHAFAANKIGKTKNSLRKLLSSLGVSKKDDFSVLFSHFIGRLPQREEQVVFEEYMQNRDMKKSKNQQELVGLILCSPAFQQY